MVCLALEPKDKKVCEIKRRKNENGGTYFRSGRFYKVDARHYFSTREGAEVGPYESIEDAAKGLERFINSIIHDGDTRLAKKLALSGNWAVTMYQ